MNISAEMFEAITKTIRGDAHDEKRKDPRVGLSGRMTIIPLPPAVNRNPTTVAVRDLAAGGIGIVHTEAFKEGQKFNLVLKYENTEKTRTLLCTVRWSQPAGSDRYAIGASFEKQKPEPAKPTKKPEAKPADKPKPACDKTRRFENASNPN
jgi:hypothetical protein